MLCLYVVFPIDIFYYLFLLLWSLRIFWISFSRIEVSIMKEKLFFGGLRRGNPKFRTD